MSEKEAKERLELFQQKNNYEPGDPRLVLVDRVLNELPIEKQIECIVSALKAKEIYGYSDHHVGEVKALITALGRLFQELDPKPLEQPEPLFYSIEVGKAYVDCLMDIYKAISTSAPVKLRLVLLRKLASHWSVSLHPDVEPNDLTLGCGREVIWRDKTEKKISQNCFQFLCWAFGTEKMSERTEIQKGILEIFRTNLDEPQKYIGFNGLKFADGLDRWILSEHVPSSIVATLLKARARALGAAGKWEVAFLEVFDFHNRTPEAIERVKVLMKEIREMEESEESERR